MTTIKKNYQCNSIDERVLGRITELEQVLSAANKQISDLINEKQDLEPKHANNLFNELMSLFGNFPSEQQFLPKSYSSIPYNYAGCNKLKKYVKINTFIKKTERLIRKINC